MTRFASAVFVVAVLAGCAVLPPGQRGDDGGAKWWKGNLHTHSLWSDGDDFPEMIMDGYKSRGWQFRRGRPTDV